MTLQGALGVRDITPTLATPLSGFAVRSGRAVGTLDPLTVSALLLQGAEHRVALVSYDLIGVPDELEGLLRERGVPADHLILCATHTHAAPPVLSRALLGDVDPVYLSRLADVTAALLSDLGEQLVPVRMHAMKVRVEGVAVNRRHRDGALDPYADVVTLRHGRHLLGLWVNYACHPVALGPDNLRYSADFPGAARRALAADLEVPVLYTTGCAGQINTGHRAEDSLTLRGLDRRTPGAMQALGERIADAVRPCILLEKGEEVWTLRYQRHMLDVTFDDPPSSPREVAERARAHLQAPGTAAGDRAMAELDLAWLARDHPQQLTLSVGVLQAGSLRAVFLPGEVFVESALHLQSHHPGVIVTAYAFTNPGYLPTADAYAEGGYEVVAAYRPYGLRGPFMPGTAERLEALGLTGLRNLT